MRRAFRKGLVGLAVSLAAATAQASFVPQFTGTTPGPSTNTTFNYNFVFVTGGDPAIERLQSGDFVTLYDIGNPLSVTLPPGFSSTLQNTGVTAPNTTPNDDPTLPNITFSYTGSTLTTSMTFIAAIVSSASTTVVDNFTSRTTFNSGPQAGTGFGQIGLVDVPAPAGGIIPEPGKLLLLGGVTCLLLLRRFDRSDLQTAKATARC